MYSKNERRKTQLSFFYDVQSNFLVNFGRAELSGCNGAGTLVFSPNLKTANCAMDIIYCSYGVSNVLFPINLFVTLG